MASFLALAGFGSKKKKKTGGEIAVVEVELFQPTHDKFPRFHLPTLIKEQTGKAFDDDNPLEDNEEYRKLESIASKFEEKYGPKRDKKGRKIKFGKPEDYMDLGMGYDLEDPFIDDSAGYDELVPSTLTPIHGGFYVNKGPLEFREVSDSDDEEDSNDEPKKKTSRLAPVVSPTSSESSSESDEETAAENMDISEGDTMNGSGTATMPKRTTPNSVNRTKGQVLKAGRANMTAKQKASASLLKSSKGWARKNKSQGGETKRGNLSAEKSESFYVRVNDVVDSVVDKVRHDQDPVASTVAAVASTNHTKSAEPSKSDLRIESVFSAVCKPQAENGTKQPKVVETAASSVSTSAPHSALENGDNGNGHKISTSKKAAVADAKEMKTPQANTSPRESRGSSPEVTVVKELPPPQSTPRLTGKPPTATQKTGEKEKWAVPPHLQKLNSLLVERAKEGGQLCFSNRTDLVLRKIMTECTSLGYNDAKLQAVLSDLSARLRVHKSKIIARWEKIKDLRADQSLRKSTAPASANSSTSNLSIASSPSSSSTASTTPHQVKKPAEVSSKPVEPGSATSTPATAAKKPSESPAPTAPVVTKKPTEASSPAAPAKKANELNLAATNIQTLQELLRQEIERQMPALETEHRKLAEEVALKKLELIQNPGSDSQKNVYTPRRKYAWNDHSKKILDAIVLKVMKHLVSDQSFVDKEDALKNYLEQQVVPMWPSGWMNARELMKEARCMYSRLFKTTEDEKSPPEAPKPPSDSVQAIPKATPVHSTIISAQALNKTPTPPSTSAQPSAPVFRAPASIQSTPPASTSSATRVASQVQAGHQASATSTARVTSQIQGDRQTPPTTTARASPQMATAHHASASTAARVSSQVPTAHHVPTTTTARASPQMPAAHQMPPSSSARVSSQVSTAHQAPTTTTARVSSQTPTVHQTATTTSSRVVSQAQAGHQVPTTSSARFPLQVPAGPQALAGSAIKLGSQMQTSPPKARVANPPSSTSAAPSPMVSQQRLGFSIHNLTSSPMSTSANSSTSSVSSTPTIARTWSTATAAMDEAQKQRAQMELALIMAAAGQAHNNPSNSPWYPRQQ